MCTVMERDSLSMPDTERKSRSSCLGLPSPESLSFTFSCLATGPGLLIRATKNTLSGGEKPPALETMQVCSGRNAVLTGAEWDLVCQGFLKGPCLWLSQCMELASWLWLMLDCGSHKESK